MTETIMQNINEWHASVNISIMMDYTKVGILKYFLTHPI